MIANRLAGESCESYLFSTFTINNNALGRRLVTLYGFFSVLASLLYVSRSEYVLLVRYKTCCSDTRGRYQNRLLANCTWLRSS